MSIVTMATRDENWQEKIAKRAEKQKNRRAKRALISWIKAIIQEIKAIKIDGNNRFVTKSDRIAEAVGNMWRGIICLDVETGNRFILPKEAFKKSTFEVLMALPEMEWEEDEEEEEEEEEEA